MRLIVASTRDIASINIAHVMMDFYNFEKTNETFDEYPVCRQKVNGEEVKLVTISSESLRAQTITDYLAPNLIVFISRHSSIPTLSVHTSGNLTDEAERGGYPKQVSISPASAMKEALRETPRQKEEKQLAYKVSYECTHHGPSLNVPTMFAELGSSPIQWKDMKAPKPSHTQP